MPRSLISPKLSDYGTPSGVEGRTGLNHLRNKPGRRHVLSKYRAGS